MIIEGYEVNGYKRRYKTVELVIDEKQVGGKWNREKKLWALRYNPTIELGLEERIVAVD
jgi:hypothetical protein